MTKIELISNSPAYFGNLNVILYCRVSYIHFKEIYEMSVCKFNPDEVLYSALDLDEMEMIDINFFMLPILKNNSILKIILIRKNEKIIIEYYQEQVLIEHMFRCIHIGMLDGCRIISKYQKEKQNTIIVIGYELSIHINSYELSLQENIADRSLHPMFVVRKDIYNNSSIEEYISDDSDVNQQMVKNIKQYLNLISIN